MPGGPLDELMQRAGARVEAFVRDSGAFQTAVDTTFGQLDWMGRGRVATRWVLAIYACMLICMSPYTCHAQPCLEAVLTTKSADAYAARCAATPAVMPLLPQVTVLLYVLATLQRYSSSTLSIVDLLVDL